MVKVIKIGGSLAENESNLRALGELILAVSRTRKITIVPGGGRFADAVRYYDQRIHLPAVVSHQLAISGMDQFAVVLSQFIPRSKTVISLKSVDKVLAKEQIPILCHYKVSKRNR